MTCLKPGDANPGICKSQWFSLTAAGKGRRELSTPRARAVEPQFPSQAAACRALLASSLSSAGACPGRPGSAWRRPPTRAPRAQGTTRAGVRERATRPGPRGQHAPTSPQSGTRCQLGPLCSGASASTSHHRREGAEGALPSSKLTRRLGSPPARLPPSPPTHLWLRGRTRRATRTLAIARPRPEPGDSATDPATAFAASSLGRRPEPRPGPAWPPASRAAGHSLASAR